MSCLQISGSVNFCMSKNDFFASQRTKNGRNLEAILDVDVLRPLIQKGATNRFEETIENI